MALPKGTLTYHSGPGGSSPTVEIHGVANLHVETQEELNALHDLVARGERLPLKPAPGQKPKR